MDRQCHDTVCRRRQLQYVRSFTCCEVTDDAYQTDECQACAVVHNSQDAPGVARPLRGLARGLVRRTRPPCLWSGSTRYALAASPTTGGPSTPAHRPALDPRIQPGAGSSDLRASRHPASVPCGMYPHEPRIRPEAGWSARKRSFRLILVGSNTASFACDRAAFERIRRPSVPFHPATGQPRPCPLPEMAFPRSNPRALGQVDSRNGMPRPRSRGIPTYWDNLPTKRVTNPTGAVRSFTGMIL